MEVRVHRIGWLIVAIRNKNCALGLLGSQMIEIFGGACNSVYLSVRGNYKQTINDK